ncbi:hypothetical protein CW703_04480 [Candidatus Bathyarchaeota archaeon]|nr:MAG: hypothetical protein CW703_04480 [Candidatus Bathyarchaeota archaeon]
MKLGLTLKLEAERKHTLKRKITHLFGVLYLLGIWLFNQHFSFYGTTMLLVTLVMFSMSVYVVYNFLKFFNLKIGVLEKLWWKLGSPELLGREKYYWDVCWLGLFLSISILLCSLVDDVRIAYIMTSTVILGDGFAGIVGIIFGKHKIFFNPKKTVEGHLSGFIIAFLVSFLLTKSFLMSFIGTGFGMFVEALPVKVSDNATVPLATTLILILVKVFLGG